MYNSIKVFWGDIVANKNNLKNRLEVINMIKELSQYYDKIRDELFERGVKLIDSREGTTYEII